MSVVRSVGQPGDWQSGSHDVAVVPQPLGQDAGLRGDDRVFVAVRADRAEPRAAGDLLAFLDGLRAGEDALGGRDYDPELRRVLALPVLRPACHQLARAIEVV